MRFRFAVRPGFRCCRAVPLCLKSQRLQSTHILHPPKTAETRLDLNQIKNEHLDSTLKLTSQNLEDSANIIDDSTLLTEIPEPPRPFSDQEFDAINLALRNTIEYFELDTYWPAGWVRVGLQSLHAYTGIPWWETIVIGVAVSRLLLLPVTITNMRNAARQAEHQPEMVKMYKKLNDAQKAGDQFQTQFAMMQLASFQKKNKLNPSSMFKTMIPQAAYFMSFVVALRRMASAPIESFKTEGFWIFTNLTATDPTWLLSILCATTLHFVLRLGVEVPTTPGALGPWMRYGMLYGMPVIVLISTHFFANALLVYWCTSNFVSLLLAGLFRVPAMRRVVNFPPLSKKGVKKKQELDEDGNPIKRTIFTRLKDAYLMLFAKKPPVDSKLTISDDVAFRKAGKGPVPPTYSYNPRERFPEAFKEKKLNLKFWKRN